MRALDLGARLVALESSFWIFNHDARGKRKNTKGPGWVKVVVHDACAWYDDERRGKVIEYVVVSRRLKRLTHVEIERILAGADVNLGKINDNGGCRSWLHN